MKTLKTPHIASPHIGNMLQNRIKLRRISKAALSRNAGRTPQTIQRYLKRPSLQFSILWELCVAMQHNFLLDLAAQLPADFTTYAPDPTLALQEALEQQKEENTILHAKLEELRSAFAKR
ncbi:hypothetical protein KXJ69_01075 [Aureisphaera sp. CAU 1614]|uniref:HTH cro/C1-type domain-containing protein n=1 Tax=Halomarinibacterium sedimenti TaxID=2857106 RepID=A0A9X1JYX3_9FLAO|nr:helix-turn-helix domain-containing protein [Halomarinibacterium sedimenti]MBW2936676.1 hypothetical protein [Halomarinibacterium sedimenti]